MDDERLYTARPVAAHAKLGVQQAQTKESLTLETTPAIFIPRPRRELRVRDLPDALVIQDPTTGQSIHLGRESSAIWIALAAGHDTPTTLCMAVPHLDPPLIRVRLKQLREGLLLDDDLWQRTAPVFHVPAPRVDPLPLHLAPELRHRCVGCGGSCTGVEIGPVPKATLAAIEAHRLFEGTPDTTSATDCVVDRPYGIQPAQFMKRADGRCVMLNGENQCAVHRAAGPGAKPGVCQQFPYTFTRGRDAIYVSLQMECRSLAASLEQGAALDHEKLLSELRVHSEGPIVNVLPDPIRLAPGVYVTQAEYLAWWSKRTDAPLDQWAADAIDWTEAIGTGEAPEWLSEAHWGETATVEPAALRAALYQQIGMATALVSQEAAKEGRLVEQEQADLVRKAALVAAKHVPLSRTHWADEGAPVLFDRAVRAAAAGHDFVQDCDLLYGLGRLRLGQSLARALSRLRAVQVGRVSVTPQDVNDALVVTNIVLRMPYMEQILKMGEAAVRAFAAPARSYAPWMGVPHPALLESSSTHGGAS